MTVDIQSYLFSRGIIHTFEDYRVMSDGRLKVRDDISNEWSVYERIGDMYEENGLSLVDVKVVPNSARNRYVGTIKNSGKKIYGNIKIGVTYYDARGQLCTMNESFCESARYALYPGETQTFDIGLPADSVPTSYTATIINYDVWWN